MRKLVIILFIILFLFFTLSVHANGAGDLSTVETEVKKILKKTSPSIVKVVSRNHKIYYATGIAIDRNHVISNLLVVRYPYDTIYIKTVAGQKIPAKVIGKDKESSIILLKIDKAALTPIKRAATCEVGDWTALVGAFYNQFPAIAQGIVSSVSDEELILNAPAAPGSSGGAVVNKNGELIGVVRGRFAFASSPDYTYKDHSGEFVIQSSRSRSKDLCIAVPAAKVVRIAGDLKKYGKIKRGWLGVTIIPANGKVKVAQVIENSPAKRAGIRKGDVILAVDGKPIKKPAEVTKIVRSLKPGQKVKIECLRGKARESALVVIGELKDKKKIWKFKFPPEKEIVVPEMAGTLPGVENYVFQFVGSRKLGVDVMTLTPQLAKELDVKEGTGLMISKVYKGTAAEKAGLRPADIIVKAGDKTIEKDSDLRRALSTLKDEEAIAIRVYRKGKLKNIKVVPDKNKKFKVTWDRLQDKLKDIKIKIDEESLLKNEEMEQFLKERKKLYEIQEKYGKEKELIRKKELEKYQKVIDKMREEQEKMREEMKKMKELLEEKKKE